MPIAGKNDLIIIYDLSVWEVWEVTRTQEMCKSQGGRPGLHVTNSPYVLCGRKAITELETLSADRKSSDGQIERGGREAQKEEALDDLP